jgi:competence protein ComEC
VPQRSATIPVLTLPALVFAQAIGLLLADRVGLPARPCAVASAVAILAATATRRRLRLALALVAVGAASAAALAARLEQASRARPAAPVARTVEGRITARDVRPGWVRLDLGDVVAVDGKGAVPVAVRLQGRDAADGALAGMPTGARLRARVTLEAPALVHNPGARDGAQALARLGIGAIARPVDPALVVRVLDAGEPSGGVRTALESLRARAGGRLGQLGPGGELLRALACGERAGMPLSTRVAFQELGLSHLLSVSGLHLVLVAGLAHVLATRALRRIPPLAAGHDVRRTALAVAVGVSAFYAVFSGFEVPVQRSLVTVAAAGLALGRRRPVRARSALVAAAALVLSAQPAALFDAGAQMSFAASAALLALRRDADDAATGASRVRGLGRALRELVSTSAAATAATAPIAATHLGVIAPAGMVANLVFVPWTGVVLLPGALVAAAAAALPGEGPVRALLLRATAAVAEWSCVAVEAIADRTPDLPPTGAPGPGVFVACIALALGATRCARLRARLACSGLSCLLLALVSPPPIEPGPPRVVFLDVGQGDATLMQGQGGAILVDAGLALPDGLDLGRVTVLPALAALRVTRLDLVVVTHGDSDHRGGVPAVLRGLPVGAVWIPPGASREPAFAAILAAARMRRVPVEEVAGGDAPFVAGDVTAVPLWPPRASRLASRNDGSLVIRVDVAGRRVLLPGDVEASAEQALVAAGDALRSDVLKLAHHGSRTSTTDAFLAAVRPWLAVASAPCTGRFGMPHPEVVTRLGASGVPWRWTGRDGALLVGLGPETRVRAFAEAPLACTPGRRREALPRAARPERPVKRGARFSTKARRASRASSLRRRGRRSPC